MLSVALIVASYLWGAVPSAYLVGRYLKGIDLREYGSGNVGASNLSEQTSWWTGLSLGIFDTVGKGTVVVIAARLMDQSLAVQAGAGAAAIAGHNWSPYIGFTGGRGVATAVGVLLGLVMWREILVGVVVVGIVGRFVFRETAFLTLITFLALPLMAYLLGQQAELVFMSLAITLLIVLKRLTGNWEARRGEFGLLRVLAFRLLWDRDVPRKAGWTDRHPPEGQRG